jgi:hypothetical protein
MTLALFFMPAHAAVLASHHSPRSCTIRDWGNTEEYHGKWYICNPSGKGFTWQHLPGRQMAS